ncbi:hypothetical protein [Arsukibacterium sp.]|uniref:hypothetical protein n=1 Tax=Arsukibacterium sp. TaxID=1977258 RepID=UPI001BD65D85|nr:hypothetical protein [Arsukibacterium sp.]
MKNSGLICIALLTGSACAAQADKVPPSAEQVWQLFLQNMTLPLSAEPNCQQVSATKPTERMTLGQHFATNLSVSFATEHNVSFSSSCEASKMELGDGQLQPVWDCKIEILEQDAQGEFISSSMTAFYLDMDATALLPGSLRCF